MTISTRAEIPRILDIAVVSAALATIPLTIAEIQGQQNTLTLAIGWALWVVFLVEVVVVGPRSIAVPQLRARAGLSGAVLVLSFPLLPGFLGLTRLARLARLVVVAGRAIPALRSIFGRRGVLYVFGVAALLVVAGGELMAQVEPATVHNPIDGMWYAIVTMTTVGYGDIAPTSPAGRLLAVVLMLTGMGLIAVMSASVAAYFVGEQDTVQHRELRERLERIEQMLHDAKLDKP